MIDAVQLTYADIQRVMQSIPLYQTPEPVTWTSWHPNAQEIIDRLNAHQTQDPKTGRRPSRKRGATAV